jgi:CubicO group peptidase (beta-lactamase class C family)
MKKVFLLFIVVSCLVHPIKAFEKDSASISSYMDGLIEAHMTDQDIAGATLSIVKDGQLLFARGYGHADLEEELPVDPEKTLFRIGSISKLFVWTAIMQLHEQGKLDLDADVNQYLEDLKIPSTYPEPVTLKDIMTHSAGFEEHVIGLFSKDSSDVRPLGEILEEQMPARVRPPGRFSSYSNHATGLAAHIVEQVSGQSFNDYVEEHIIHKLGLSHTTFRQPVPDHIPGKLSKGYKYANGEFHEKGFEYVPLAPAGAASSTAIDMARLMIACLNPGGAPGSMLLDSTTHMKMQSNAFRMAPHVNALPHGFMNMSMNNKRIIGHGGDTFWFHSLLAFIPEENTGLFVSFNTDKGGGTTLDILEEVMDHYYPEKISEPDYSMKMEELKQFEGRYRANRYPHQRFTKVMALMNPTEVSVVDSSKLKVKDREARYYVPVDDLTFREENSSRTLVFKENNEGEITHMIDGLVTIVAFEKIPFIDSMQLHGTLMTISLIILIVTLVYWPLAYFIRREYRQPMEKHLPGKIKLWGWLAALVFLVFVAGLSTMLSDSNQIVFGLSPAVRGLFVLPLVGAALTLVVLYLTYRVWKRKAASLSGKIHYTLLVLVLLASLWQLNHWNMLGFHF